MTFHVSQKIQLSTTTTTTTTNAYCAVTDTWTGTHIQLLDGNVEETSSRSISYTCKNPSSVCVFVHLCGWKMGKFTTRHTFTKIYYWKIYHFHSFSRSRSLFRSHTHTRTHLMAFTRHGTIENEAISLHIPRCHWKMLYDDNKCNESQIELCVCDKFCRNYSCWFYRTFCSLSLSF